MEAFFSWVGAALGALLVVAVLVAWWEHLVRSSRRPATAPASPPVRAVTVDVPLDTLTAPPPGDTAARQAALDGALQRMASPAPAPGGDASAWIETEPMVLGPALAHAPAHPPAAERAPEARRPAAPLDQA